jgi:signal transduction histidine kinase/AmiR/NasT family two-component response regulator
VGIPESRSSKRTQIALCAASIVGYAASVCIRRGLMTASPEAAIWLAGGLIAGLLLLDRRYRIGCLAACFVVNVVCCAYYGFSLKTFLTFPIAAAVIYLTERLVGPGLNFADPRRLGLFLACAVAPVCAVFALLQTVIPLNAPPLSAENAARWFVGHTLGLAILVPSIVVLARARRFTSFERTFAETFTALFLMVGFVAFLLWHEERTGWALVVFPLAMFIAFRYGPVGVSVLSLMLTALACAYVYGAIPHLGAARLSYSQTEWVQVLVSLVFLTSLPVAGVVAYLQRMHGLLGRRTSMARVARTRADTAARAKGEFLANMSHEIRTPLNGVIGLADALSRTPLRHEQKEMLDMILSSGQALRGLLSDALDLARAESGALMLSEEPFDARKTVGAAAYLFETLARGKGLAFDVSFNMDADEAARRLMVGDALRIRQIVSNLISNAIKFTEQGGVRVEACLTEMGQDDAGADRGRLIVTVRDTGRGFDATVKARLFNRFEQGDNSVTRRYGGSGLGLSIVRELADMMGGEVTCESEPGIGSAFFFAVDLPLQTYEGPSLIETAEAAETPDAADPARQRVLLAEDHPVNQRVVQAILGDGFDLTIVADGQAAIHAFLAQDFDVVLMDTHMPVMDGLTAVRSIRRLEAERGGERTPIVSLTADALPEHINAALRAGADAHLAKPITAATLFAALAAVAGEETMHDAEADGRELRRAR